MVKSVLERLAAKSSISERGCFVWTGQRNPDGYGYLSVDGRLRGVHVLAWIEHHGPLPADKPCVLHKCDNPPCWNEAHLWPGTQAENMADRRSKGPWIGGRHSVPRSIADVIRHRLSTGETQTAIAHDLGINQATVSRIKTGCHWAARSKEN